MLPASQQGSRNKLVKRPIHKKKGRGPVRKTGKPPSRPSGPAASRPSGPAAAGRPGERTLEEAKYLKHLSKNGIPVLIRLRNNEEFSGTVEYYDASFIRLTRENAPNLFIYKHDVKYLCEQPAASSEPAESHE
jgi:sRNA-binding regulator protein Hfq